MTVGERRVRYGVIGTGMMGIEHVENIGVLPGAAITAIADTNACSLANGRRAAGPGAHTFTDHRDLLESGLCDAVVVATPNHTHFNIVSDVLATDLHALVEKPLCTNVADSERLIELDARRPAGAITWVGLEYRYMPAAAELIRRVHTGDVGTPRMVAMREHRYPFLPKVDGWNRLSANTGGTLVEKTCHFFDLMNLILGERPSRVMASGAQDVNHLDEIVDGQPADVLDNAFVLVDYPSGARAMLDLCMFAEATHNQEELSVVGTAGKVEALIPQSTVRIGRRGEHWIGDVESYRVQGTSIAHQGLHHGSSYLEHVHFLAAIGAGAPPEVTLDDGLWSVAMGVAAHRSIELGRPVEMNEVLPRRADPNRVTKMFWEAYA
jgi:myo-inositol 2-dehydrogenase / D-chiro-inositol 1-dehydrogenase